jgi:hypothetical protein
MKPTWLIEADVFGEAAEPLKAALRRQAVPFQVVTQRMVAAGASGLPGEGECVVFHGSPPLMRHIQLHRRWLPGGWYARDDLRCSTYAARLGPFLLNSPYALLPGVEALRLRDWLFDTFARDGQVFVRPDAPDKLFTGRCVARDDWESALAPTRYDPATLVLTASPQTLGREWRLVVAGDEVVSASRYASAGVRDFAPGCPGAVCDFAYSVLGSTSWRPDDLFLMDVAEVGGELRLVELGGFSCSGLYACDPDAVVRAANERAVRAWRRDPLAS